MIVKLWGWNALQPFDRFGGTSLYKTISSLKVRPQSNVARKIWAYLTIQDAIKDDQTNNSKVAYEASLEQNFLTPYTDAIFGAEEGKIFILYLYTYFVVLPFYIYFFKELPLKTLFSNLFFLFSRWSNWCQYGCDLWKLGSIFFSSQWYHHGLELYQ